MTEEDASFIQNYANAGRIEKLTNEFSTIRDSLIVEGEKLSDEKKDSLYRQMGIIGKKINESIMHNGMKNIDYKNSDLLLEKLTPHASKLAAGFDGEASAISVFESFLPGYYINNQKMAEQKMASVRQTDLILGYWWQMKVENGQRPSEELENFFKSNPVSNGNLKDILHKLRLKMAKEHAEEACSEKSRIRQKEFNDMGGACSIMNNNRKAGKIHYLRFEDFSNSLSSLSDGLNEKILSDKKDHQKILYNSTIAHKICSNKVDMMGPYQESRLPPQKFKSDGWDNLKKNIQEDLVSKQSRSQSVISSYREERKKEYEKQRLNINSSEMKKISAINESKSVNTNDPKEVIKQINPTEILKPKIDNNIANRNLNNFLGNNPVTQIVKPIVDDMGRSKLERDIESRLKVIDEKINNSRQNSAMKESVEEDSIAKERVNLDQLLKEKAELQNSLLELANTSSKKVKKTDPKPADTIADENDNSNSETSVRDDRSMRKNRDSKVASSTATDSSAMDSRDSSDIASATISEAKASVKAGGSSSVKTDFGIVLTKTGEPATDFNQMVANPSESDLIRLAEKSNGEPFLINENGEVVRVLVKKDLKGKLFFEKIKLTNEQKKKLAVKKDMVRSIKEIGSAPIRKIELDKLMKETR
jgi:hypothetical protein